MKTLKTILLVALLALPGITFAGPAWTFVDLGLNTADSGDERTTGYGLRGSFGFGDLFHVGLGIEQNEWAGGKSKSGVDETAYDIWVGLHPAMGEKVDLVLDLGYLSSEFDFGSSSSDVDVTALYLRTGPRALIANEKLELYGYLALAAGEDKGGGSTTDWTGIGYTVGGQFYFTPAISLGAEVDVGGAATPASQVTSADQLKIFLRWSFGQ